MLKKYKINWQIYLMICMLMGIGLMQSAYAENVIYPGVNPTDPLTNSKDGGDIKWYPDKQTLGTAEITNTKPNNGNASLELHTSGAEGTGVFDWAFYNRYADDTDVGWGLLSNITSLSFDWFRTTNYRENDPIWNAQTPVLRLYVNDTGKMSELVWEKWYTNLYNTSSVELNTWDEQDILNGYDDQLWRHVFGTEENDNGTYTAILNGTNTIAQVLSIDYNMLVTYGILDWASAVNSTTSARYYSDNAFVYGIGVGVGSYWPHEYVGYVDNINLSSYDWHGVSTVQVNDNFELPVPEPSSIILLMFGLCSLIASRFSRRWRSL